MSAQSKALSPTRRHHGKLNSAGAICNRTKEGILRPEVADDPAMIYAQAKPVFLELRFADGSKGSRAKNYGGESRGPSGFIGPQLLTSIE